MSLIKIKLYMITKDQGITRIFLISFQSSQVRLSTSSIFPRLYSALNYSPKSLSTSIRFTQLEIKVHLWSRFNSSRPWEVMFRRLIKENFICSFKLRPKWFSKGSQYLEDFFVPETPMNSKHQSIKTFVKH